MKFKTLLFTLVLAILFGAVLPRQAEARVTFSYFYDSLQPYGEWVDVDTHGYCWQPRGMDRDWRPYTDGYWSYTDAGWTWVSYEDFGAITYHYGRWVNLEDYGWVWKPDYEWGPAWVSWRQSDDYIGWAPLPPDAVFEPQTGIGVWVDRDYDIGPSAYSFCEYRYFGAPVMRNVLLPRHRNVAIINSTVNITNITIVTGNNHSRMVFNGGLNYAHVAARSQNRIETLQLVRQTDGDWAQHHRSELSRRVGAQLFINAPEVEAPKQRFAPTVVSQQIHAPKIDTGWAGVSNPAERAQIKARYHEQTQGLTRATAPAWTLNTTQAQAMVSEARTHQKPASQPATAVPLPIQIQQPTPVQKEYPHHKEQQQRQVQQPAATPLPMQVQQPTPAQKETSHHREQPQGQVIPSVEQPKIQQEQAQRAQQAQAQAEQQRRAAEAEARAARQQQEQAQRAQQVQAQAEQQHRAAEAEARAARQQQEQAQRAQQVQAQAEQQHRAAEAEARAARQQQEQTQRAQQVQAQAEQQRRAAEAEARAARQQQEQTQRAQQAQAQAQRAQQEQAAKQARQPQGQQQPEKRKHEGPSPSPTP